jgi:simple sugar transport system ATP-binding protein
MTERRRLFSAKSVVKRFGAVIALDGVDVDVDAGEVLAIVGDNGAGKSTLVKILSGVHRADSGTIELDGQPVDFHTPLEARQLGIDTAYQDLALAPDLSSVGNLFLGREICRTGFLGRLGFLDHERMNHQAAELLERLAINIPDLQDSVGKMSGGQRQSIAVARAVAGAGKVVIMDEPTAALGVAQTRHVLDLIKRVRDDGSAVILVSHNMADVLDVADRIVVLRLGRNAGEFAAADVSVNDLVSAITGISPDTKGSDLHD